MKVRNDWALTIQLPPCERPCRLNWILTRLTDMFRALHASDLPSSTVFTVIVGAQDKVSDAYYYLSDPALVWETIAMFNKCDAGSPLFVKLL